MIVTLTGSNTYMLGEEARRRQADFIAKYGDLALEKVDSEEVEPQRVIEAMQALPFLAPKRLVVLRNPSFHKSFTEDFEKLINNIPDTTDTIIFETKVDKRSVYYKTLKKLTDFKEYVPLGENELIRWIQDYVKSLHGAIDFSSANYLVNLAGANQQLLANEIQKLINYNSQITKTTIDLLVERTPQSTVFNLLDAALGGQKKRVIEIYEQQRRQKVEPLNILGMIAWQLHVLALLKTAGNRSVDEIAAESGVNPFVLRKSVGIASKLTIAELKELVAQAFRLDVRLKSESIDADEALQNYLLKLSQ